MIKSRLRKFKLFAVSISFAAASTIIILTVKSSHDKNTPMPSAPSSQIKKDDLEVTYNQDMDEEKSHLESQKNVCRKAIANIRWASKLIDTGGIENWGSYAMVGPNIFTITANDYLVNTITCKIAPIDLLQDFHFLTPFANIVATFGDQEVDNIADSGDDNCDLNRLKLKLTIGKDGYPYLYARLDTLGWLRYRSEAKCSGSLYSDQRYDQNGKTMRWSFLNKSFYSTNEKQVSLAKQKFLALLLKDGFVPSKDSADYASDASPQLN